MSPDDDVMATIFHVKKTDPFELLKKNQVSSGLYKILYLYGRVFTKNLTGRNW